MSKNSTGWIKLHRSILDDDIWQLDKINYAQAWIELLLLTNHAPAQIKIKNGRIINIERGECGHSVKSLAERWGWSRGKVDRFLLYLIEQQKIEKKDVENHTVIKIINYNFYQNEHQTKQQTGHQTKQETVIQPKHQTDTNNNVNNYKNENNNGDVAEEMFAEFLKVYPIRGGMNEETALNAWKQAVLLNDYEKIIIGAKIYGEYIAAENIADKYVKHPHRWLSERGWKVSYGGDKEPPLQPKERDEIIYKGLKWKNNNGRFITEDEKKWMQNYENQERKTLSYE